MKIGRTIGISIAALLLVVIAAVVYVLSSLDSIVAGAIEKYGSQVTRTPVSVSALSIDLQGGAAGIRQLSVGNPAGFSAPDIFTLGGISTRLNVASIGKDPIIIEEIRVENPAVFYEINKSGKSNIKELQKNIEQSTGGAQSADDSTASAGPKVVIRKLLIEGGSIDARVAALGDKPHTAKLPRIQLNNIGDPAAGGASGAEVTRQVMDAIIAKVIPAVASLGLDRYVGKSLDEARSLLDEKVGEKVGESVGEKARQGGESLKNLIGK